MRQPGRAPMLLLVPEHADCQASPAVISIFNKWAGGHIAPGSIDLIHCPSGCPPTCPGKQPISACSSLETACSRAENLLTSEPSKGQISATSSRRPSLWSSANKISFGAHRPCVHIGRAPQRPCPPCSLCTAGSERNNLYPIGSKFIGGQSSFPEKQVPFLAREAMSQLATGLGHILWKMLMYNFLGKVIVGVLKKKKTSLRDLKG